MEDRVVEHGPSHFELWLNEVQVPHLNRGVLQAALEIIGAKNCTVDVSAKDDAGTTYTCRWE